VIEDAKAVLYRELHGLRSLAVAREHHVGLARLLADRRDLVFGIGQLLRAARRERLVAGQQKFDRVDSRLRHLLHVGAHRLRATRMFGACPGFQAERAVGQPLER
jgi:hypothetical protein